jgi:hypothetical protein
MLRLHDGRSISPEDPHADRRRERISLYAKEAAACYGSELVSQLEYVGLAGA